MTHLYFAAHEGRIKIGIARDVAKRLRDVGNHLTTQLTLIDSMPGTYPFKKAVHRHLKTYRIKGEWFRDCPVVRGVIDRLLAEGPAAINFEEPPPRAPYVPHVFTREEILIRDVKLLNLLYPQDSYRHFAEFVEQPEETVRAWFEGAVEWPRLMYFIFTALVTRLIILAMLNAIKSGAEKAVIGVFKDRRPLNARRYQPEINGSGCSSPALACALSTDGAAF